MKGGNVIKFRRIFKKFFIVLLTVLVLNMSLNREVVLAYDQYNQIQLERTYPQTSVVTNTRAVALALPLVSEYAVPAVLNVAMVFVMGLSIADQTQVTTDFMSRFETGTLNTFDNSKIVDYVKKQIQKLHPATIGYLIMAGAGADNAGVEQELEDAGWSPQFIKNVKEELTGGGGTGGSSGQDPKGKISLESLKKFGVLGLMTFSFLGALYKLITDNQVMSSNDTHFGSILGFGSTAYRSIPLLPGEAGKTTGTGSFNMKYGKDLNMDLVSQVHIQMGRVKLYNYGWDGVVYKQEYKLKSIANGKEFLFVVFIGKALSPNQYVDKEWDGVTYGFYELDELGNIIEDSIHNMYNNRLDVSRLEMMNSTVPQRGTQLYRITGLEDHTGFAYMRNKIRECLGADLFPSLALDYNFLVNGKYSIAVDLFCDFSKGVTGTYNNLWQSIEGEPVLNDFSISGNYQVAFPNAGIPTGNGLVTNIHGPEGIFVAGITGASVGQKWKDKIDNKEEVYTQGSSSSSIDTSLDIPTNEELDQAFPDVGNPAIPKPDEGTDTETPPDTGTDAPAMPDFGSIPDAKININPLLTAMTNFTERFPFSLPWDVERLIKNTFTLAQSSAEAPVIIVPIVDLEVKMDFNLFNALASIVRGFVYIEFLYGLILLTRKLKP